MTVSFLPRAVVALTAVRAGIAIRRGKIFERPVDCRRAESIHGLRPNQKASTAVESFGSALQKLRIAFHDVSIAVESF
jgi:hypothetical protein